MLVPISYWSCVRSSTQHDMTAEAKKRSQARQQCTRQLAAGKNVYMLSAVSLYVLFHKRGDSIRTMRLYLLRSTYPQFLSVYRRVWLNSGRVEHAAPIAGCVQCRSMIESAPCLVHLLYEGWLSEPELTPRRPPPDTLPHTSCLHRPVSRRPFACCSASGSTLPQGAGRKVRSQT